MLRHEREGATAILTLDDPQRRNALGIPMRAALVAALEAIESDATLRAVVITGAGGNFSGGGDIAGMNVTDLGAGRERFRLTHQLVRLMIEGGKPFIAAVEGWAVGAGLAVALCCDTIIAASDARFMAGFGKVGLVPDFGLVHTLPRRIGEGRARQMVFRPEPIDAVRGEGIGLVDQLCAPGQALTAALAIAATFADGAPLPVALTKARLAHGLAEALAWEREAQSALFLTADHAEGKAAFLEKRPPRFVGR